MHMFRKNGRPAKQIRMALWVLLIKEYLGLTEKSSKYLRQRVTGKNGTQNPRQKQPQKSIGSFGEVHSEGGHSNNRLAGFRQTGHNMKLFTGFVRQRKPSVITIRKVKGKQLNYLKRNLAAIEKMRENVGAISEKQGRQLETIQMLYEQQREMYEKRNSRIDDRIVSISQPHIRPIVCGKAGTPVEFGAKINMSVINVYVFLNEIRYDSFYEGDLLENAIIDYYCRFGILPSKILAD